MYEYHFTKQPSLASGAQRIEKAVMWA